MKWLFKKHETITEKKTKFHPSDDHKGMKEVLEYIDNKEHKKDELERILMYAKNILSKSKNRRKYEHAEIEPIFSYIKIFTDYIQTKKTMYILGNTDSLPLENNEVYNFNVAYHNNIDKLVPYNHREPIKLEKPLLVRNGKEPIITEIWNSARIADCISNIGKGIYNKEQEDNSFESEELNHYGTYIYPMGIISVDMGNHSINAGMIKSEGNFYIDKVIDISSIYENSFFNGMSIENQKYNFEDYVFFELGVLFEIGRLLMSDKSLFPKEIQDVIDKDNF